MRFSGKRLILQARFPTVHYNLLSTKVTDSVVLFCKLPNISTKVFCKHNLEPSIIYSAAFEAGFLEIILSF